MSVVSVPRSRLALPWSASGHSEAPNPSVTSAGIAAAAQRFAALSASARHAWLATHLAALRAGTVTLARIP
jgi:hypothetical protein